jgi:hypothetical protein
MAQFGVWLIIISFTSLGFWTHWCNTRTWSPISMPVSLSQGNHIQTDEFILNLNGLYDIYIDVDNKLPFNMLACSAGVTGLWRQGPCNTSSVVKISWTLSSEGKLVAQGSSDDTQGGGGGSEAVGVMRDIGDFQGKNGQRYKLDIYVLADGSSLAAANPRLRVSKGGTTYESSLVMGGLLRLVCYWSCSIHCVNRKAAPP